MIGVFAYNNILYNYIIIVEVEQHLGGNDYAYYPILAKSS